MYRQKERLEETEITFWWLGEARLPWLIIHATSGKSSLPARFVWYEMFLMLMNKGMTSSLFISIKLGAWLFIRSFIFSYHDLNEKRLNITHSLGIYFQIGNIVKAFWNTTNSRTVYSNSLEYIPIQALNPTNWTLMLHIHILSLTDREWQHHSRFPDKDTNMAKII